VISDAGADDSSADDDDIRSLHTRTDQERSSILVTQHSSARARPRSEGDATVLRDMYCRGADLEVARTCHLGNLPWLLRLFRLE
jgi:hypothetical protein